MSDIHSFERWKRDVYPRYWIRKSRQYGLDFYCKGLLALIKERQPVSAFELAIGTGYPFAKQLLGAGIDVVGCDISQELITELKKDFPGIAAFVGGYEDFDVVKGAVTQRFDLVYCLRSTWYFTDIAAAIDFMLHFARPGGMVIFDIMNKDSEYNKAMVEKTPLVLLTTAGKNAIKFVANLVSPGRFMLDTLSGIREVMYSPDEISRILNDRGCAYEELTLAQIEARGGRKATAECSFSADQKLVYVVRKS